MKNVLISAIVSLLVTGGVIAMLPQKAEQPFGVTAGNDFTGLVSFSGGVVNSRSVATSSQGNVTVSASEFRNWANGSVVSFSPGLLAGATLTLPASTSLAALVPKAGDRQSFCIRNATSTAGVPVTFAGGLGTKLVVASSSATALGSSVLLTGKVGCFTLIRETATSTAYDIDALFTAFN